jgi:multidrug efflux pump subunit AcrA (membrane-fusion protein)
LEARAFLLFVILTMNRIITGIKKNRYYAAGVLGIILASGFIFFSKNDEKKSTQVLSSEVGPIVSEVGNEYSAPESLVSSTNTWPAEIISSKIASIQPQREGVITEWNVRVGDSVRAGQVLGRISAPPATPELVAMLAEQREGLARAEAGARATDEYAEKEQARFSAMRSSLGTSDSDQVFTALEALRRKSLVKKASLRSFVEQSLTRHVSLVTNYTDWRNVKSGSIKAEYGILSQGTRGEYEAVLLSFVEKLKNSNELSVEDAQKYFATFVRLANYTFDGEMTSSSQVKMVANEDQTDFLEMLSEFRESEMEVADKETEYKLMISEKSAMVERERAMARAEVEAARESYKTVSGEITGGSAIIATRSGAVSAIYKKVGELVGPEMAVAVVVDDNPSNILIRMHIPNNIKKPARGDELATVRPGFPKDVQKIKIVGVGTSLDEVGSYMADATFVGRVDWAIGTSIRVIPGEVSNSILVKESAVWWDAEGKPNIWMVSPAGRIYSKKILIGRVLGSSMEVYEGLKKGDKYISNPDSTIKEDMLITDVKNSEPINQPKGEHTGHEGHEM